MNNFGAHKIQLNVAHWVSREPYVPLSDCAKKIGDRLQRKFNLKVASKILEEKIRHYREIYITAKKNLPQYTLPSKSGYAESQYIQKKGIEEFLRKKFPGEDIKILNTIISWVVEYEYLR